MNKNQLYDEMEKASAEPYAGSMIETFRAIGYSAKTAVADIIDNSITAGAKTVWVDYEWRGPDTVLSIIDNGVGMKNDELIQAMRPGSKSPLDFREENDLGRFGLGLKTASFSQTRKFSVVSKTEESMCSYWCWDLDYVNTANAWNLLKYCPNIETWVSKINELASGTCVLWWDLDRLTKNSKEDSKASRDKFMTAMEEVKTHLSMVFHRFIEDGLNIYFRNRKIEGWDPFMIGVEGINPRPTTPLQGGKVRVKGFVLPHRSKLSVEQYKNGQGPYESWTAHQGFYVYRNNRLLVAGDWLGLFKREMHFDLCRIRIDLTNDIDEEWQIDIKKSKARPPVKYREQIIALAKDAINTAVEVYNLRGKVIQRTLSQDQFIPLWEERVRHGKRFYKVNRNHPIIENLLSGERGSKGAFEKVLQFIEETIPVPLISLRESENEKPLGQPFEGIDHSSIKETIKKLFTLYLANGMTEENAKKRIMSTEPYNYYPEYVERLNHDL
jgi:hypothetical protein